MDEDDSEDVRETITLMNQLTAKVSTKSATKFTSKTSQILRMQDSAEDSDTMECASENEVENLPRDEDASQLTKTRDRIYERSPYSLDVPEDIECTMTRKKTTVSSLRVASDDAKYSSSRLGFFMVANRSPQSSSSQEEYEPEVKSISRLQTQQQRQQQQQQQQQQHLLTAGSVSGQVTARSMESLRSSRNFLSADDRYSEDSKSMESLSSSSETHVGSTRSHYRSFLTTSTRDVRRIVTVESRSSENLHREESLNAEVRRGLFANTGLERKIPQHLSLPPPSNVFSLTSPGGSDRKITILSPHSPVQTSEFPFPASASYKILEQTLKSRRKKAIVLPRLVLPRSESEVFLEWVVEWSNFLLSAVVLSVYRDRSRRRYCFAASWNCCSCVISAFRYCRDISRSNSIREVVDGNFITLSSAD